MKTVVYLPLWLAARSLFPLPGDDAAINSTINIKRWKFSRRDRRENSPARWNIKSILNYKSRVFTGFWGASKTWNSVLAGEERFMKSHQPRQIGCVCVLVYRLILWVLLILCWAAGMSLCWCFQSAHRAKVTQMRKLPQFPSLSHAPGIFLTHHTNKVNSFY